MAPPIPKINISVIIRKIRTRRPAFSLKRRLWNFNEIMGILLTIRRDKTIERRETAHTEPKKGPIISKSEYSLTKTMATTPNALAGEANPLKDSFWLSSILNLARRIAAEIAIIAGTARVVISPTVVVGPPEKTVVPVIEDRIVYTTTAGATPKLTTSARESRSLPMGENAFNNLAEKPSKKSKTMAAIISHAAVVG